MGRRARGKIGSTTLLTILICSPAWATPLPVEAEGGIRHLQRGLGYGPDWGMMAGPAQALFGWSVAGAGDVNCDGYDDIIVGSPGFDNGLSDEGLVIVYHGSAQGLSIGPGNWVKFGQQEDAELGFSVASAGDVNNDGCGDVIIGAPGYTHNTTGEGGAWVFHGSPEGLEEEPDNFDYGNQEYAKFGWSVGCAGDVNHDGFDDVFVGTPFYDNPSFNEGTVWVWHGTSSGISNLANWSYEIDFASAQLGSAVAPAGDVNGDGYDDVIVGAPYLGGTGMAMVFHGRGPWIFYDDFESGDTDNWSLANP